MIKFEPIITETTIANAQKNWFTFRALPLENKNSLKEKIEKTFKVDVLAVKTMVMKGKNKRSLKSRKIIKQGDWKKVLVRLKDGQKIDLFELGGK
ncbi:50S ribosomal protein L23 [Candidatus Shapirobacteria bacterium CG03_land_8_20_14_0_80_40_19]|uniref:Large ribosomal subunit protein uL23 n=4 Tax=Candidatus Shapironibacteriota TaxID=1752721 RepID=A0A2M7BDZ4_9BACT|nr:MAG: 50S ribosomal protein L23 [Candidatus Shapirobacteria bacterium CG11_big_fil_rev_8_21_14_0_20_40_12]PIV01317.1 MAG: 50S ribosomal protein L23 [Candidatus Shapirobacteria bacterium CG03_land_8_20_14_0_80_40_19]PJC29193.1 MAG: 50S ribosomal protein L23 [Candidatus Shapirobacteria bacterium CG_4_9_14_0_2_um_filter_40_11]PJC76652.1 MAG: 50S ribosomal protein L23 [Candidatus Shapirobacteria bacterium CG_4_8_14_3_um_filter_39_11]